MSVDDRLRQLLHDERLSLPAWPDAVQRVNAGIARRRRYRLRRVLGLAGVVVVALVGAAGVRLALVPADTGPTRTDVPWLAQEIDAPHQDPFVPGPLQTARPCGPADLPTTVDSTGDHVLDQNGTQLIVSFGLNPVAGARCTVAGYAALVGTDVATGVRRTVEAGRRGRLMLEHHAWEYGRIYPAVVGPREQARFDVVVTGGCATSQRYHKLAVVIAGREVPIPGATLDVACSVAIGEWYLEVPEGEPVGRYSRLTARLETPDTVGRTETLVYTVILMNPTDRPIRLDRCPVYRQQLGKRSGYFRLNCEAGDIPAHGERRYEMRLPPEPDAPLLASDQTLSWDLVEAVGTTVSASSPIDVVG